MVRSAAPGLDRNLPNRYAARTVMVRPGWSDMGIDGASGRGGALTGGADGRSIR